MKTDPVPPWVGPGAIATNRIGSVAWATIAFKFAAMSRPTKKNKIKPVLSQEFQDACLWHKMEVANYSFEAVRDGIRSVLKRKIQTNSPEYYPIVVGLICIYARPFTNNWPVGPLTDEIVPPEHKNFHGLILDIRHKLFAHTEASLAIREDDYPNDVILANEGKEPFVQLRRFAIEPTPPEHEILYFPYQRQFIVSRESGCFPLIEVDRPQLGNLIQSAPYAF